MVMYCCAHLCWSRARWMRRVSFFPFKLAVSNLSPSNLPAISFSVTYPCCVLLDLTQYLYQSLFLLLLITRVLFLVLSYLSFGQHVGPQQFSHCGLRLAEKIWFAHMATTCKAWRSGFFVTEWTLLFRRALSRLVCTCKVFWKFQASTSNTLCCHPAQISRDSALCVAASTFASVSRCHSPLQVPVKLRWKRRCWQVREQLQQWFVAQNKLFERCLVGCLAPQETPDGHPWRVHALTRTQWCRHSHKSQMEVPIKRIHTALLLTSFEALSCVGVHSQWHVQNISQVLKCTDSSLGRSWCNQDSRVNEARQAYAEALMLWHALGIVYIEYHRIHISVLFSPSIFSLLMSLGWRYWWWGGYCSGRSLSFGIRRQPEASANF